MDDLADSHHNAWHGASQHTTTPREANLITTRRDGRAVRHLRTPLGAALADGALA